MSQEERMSRAGDYVLGLMDDHERQRAERDMEMDAEFRDCVLRLAERFRVIGHVGKEEIRDDELWVSVGAHLAALPQMRTGAPVARIAGAEPARGQSAGTGRNPPDRFDRWRAAVIAACLVIAWSLGFLAGRATAPLPQPDMFSGSAVRPPR